MVKINLVEKMKGGDFWSAPFEISLLYFDTDLIPNFLAEGFSTGHYMKDPDSRCGWIVAIRLFYLDLKSTRDFGDRNDFSLDHSVHSFLEKTRASFGVQNRLGLVSRDSRHNLPHSVLLTELCDSDLVDL